MDNTPGDKLGVWRDMRLADALVIIIIIISICTNVQTRKPVKENNNGSIENYNLVQKWNWVLFIGHSVYSLHRLWERKNYLAKTQ